MDRWDTSPKRVTSPTWVPPPPGKQALNLNALRNRALSLNEFVNKCNGRDQGHPTAIFGKISVRRTI